MLVLEIISMKNVSVLHCLFVLDKDCTVKTLIVDFLFFFGERCHTFKKGRSEKGRNYLREG